MMRSDDAGDAHHRRHDAHDHRTASQGRRFIIVAMMKHAGVMGWPRSIACRNERRPPAREGGPNPALTLAGA
jgi:hypothetical protein